VPKPTDFTDQDVALLTEAGIDLATATEHLERLRRPPVAARLHRPCTIGDGIEQLDPAEQARLAAAGSAAAAEGRVTKFVPASGAATRMFKDLLAALNGPNTPSTSPAVREFFERLDEFPFSDDLRRRAKIAGPPESEAEERHLLRILLEEMRYADLPKALIPFHRADPSRTPLEEHLLEGAEYARDRNGISRLHFTVPADNRSRFESAVEQMKRALEARLGDIGFHVSLSIQERSTDTLALDESGGPFRLDDGRLLLRPAGHGSLLRNLQQSGGDIVVIKNIDNVVPHERSAEVVHWKQVLIGRLAALQAEVFACLEALTPDWNENVVDEAARLATSLFGRQLPATSTLAARRQAVIAALNRPLRVCGVVQNLGEPGGAPFWVEHSSGEITVQIVEAAQVDQNDPQQLAIFDASSHFNPVDVVCGLRSFDGTPFELDRFVDPDTAFVSSKTFEERQLTCLERPGLWNGGMAGWNTVCVDVPASTFAPVKSVMDLLRPAHRS
jgi:hypothetical protein